MSRIATRSRSTIAAVFLLAVAVGIGATTLAATAAPAPHERPLAVPACSSSTLVNWLNTTGNGTAGSVYYTLNFTNLSSHSCTLKGYPGVSAVSLAAKQIGAAAGRATSSVKTVTIPAGGSAKTLVQVVITGNFTPSDCKAVTAAGFRVYAPNQTGSNVIPFPFSVCSKSSEVSLFVQAVTK
jgi:hypothetical protein